jgi:DNA-directed RNA polymerase delta subunit
MGVDLFLKICYSRQDFKRKYMESILDQVISSKHLANLENFDPHQILENILNSLSEREQSIIRLRHGLAGHEKKTLEEIGKDYKVTRERVRQIENTSLKKINKNFDKTYLKQLEDVANGVLSEHGGLMSEENLTGELLIIPGDNKNNRSAIKFILNQLLKDRFHFVKETKETHNLWKTPEASLESFHLIIDNIHSLIDKHGEPLPLELLINKVSSADFFVSNEELTERVVVNFIHVTKKIKSNPYGEWGLAHWSEISPRRMNDKIFLVLKKEKKPLHFTAIAETINKMSFDERQAYPATIHNELILDEKYVLVGRGIYALKDWGYKPGVVSDVISDILKEKGMPLSKKEIIAEVLKRRLIKETTINLALMNKNRFSRDEKGRYILKKD